MSVTCKVLSTDRRRRNNVSDQLPLRLALRDSATFGGFIAGANGAAMHALQSGLENFIYLWGASGTGKSHLLQALCHASTESGAMPAYLAMDELIGTDPEVFEGLEAMSPVCVDQVQAIIGRPAWEHALFHLYNRVRDAGGRLVVAGHAAPAQLGLALPDLVSRLAWGPVFQLQPLDDADKREALQRRARVRGMELSDDVAAYLLRRCARDMHSLFALLDRLDRESLIAKRRLTIPFVRELLG
jgi:DnaA family protein